MPGQFGGGSRFLPLWRPCSVQGEARHPPEMKGNWVRRHCTCPLNHGREPADQQHKGAICPQGHPPAGFVDFYSIQPHLVQLYAKVPSTGTCATAARLFSCTFLKSSCGRFAG